VLFALGAGVLFLGMATLFAELLRPLAPSQAAVIDSDEPPAPPPSAGQRFGGTGVKVEPPLAEIPADELDKLIAEEARAVAAKAAPLPEGPLVAIILTELGPDSKAANDAIQRLPAGVSLAFSPYADASRGLASAAKARGHEVWVSVPMQPKSYPRVSPGKNALLTAESAAENSRRLEWALSRVDAPVGITNMMGSAFTENAGAMRPVLGVLKAKNLMYVDARSSGKSIGEAEAKALGVAAATNDRFLDEPETAANIRRNLDDLIAAAKRQGQAVGFARPTPETIKQIESWAAGLDAKGVKLVGASFVARKNAGG
jgi:polysaccharide deacetylase 2 family uncharacterized protein YibQ